MRRTLLIAAALVTVPVIGAIAMGEGKSRFEALDTDKDGKVAMAEMQTANQNRFGKMDADGDGVVSRDEVEARMMARIRAHIQGQVDNRMERMDADKDGVISKAEASVASDAHFVKMDKNQDGFLDADEMPKGKRHGGHHGSRRGHGHGPKDAPMKQ